MKVKMKHQYMTRNGLSVELDYIEVDSSSEYVVKGTLNGMQRASWNHRGSLSTSSTSDFDLVRIITLDNKYAKVFSELPEGYDWLAMDADNTWFAHKSKPAVDDVNWVSDGIGNCKYVNLPPVKNWKRSLKKRKDYIVNSGEAISESHSCDDIKLEVGKKYIRNDGEVISIVRSRSTADSNKIVYTDDTPHKWCYWENGRFCGREDVNEPYHIKSEYVGATEHSSDKINLTDTYKTRSGLTVRVVSISEGGDFPVLVAIKEDYGWVLVSYCANGGYSYINEDDLVKVDWAG